MVVSCARKDASKLRPLYRPLSTWSCVPMNWSGRSRGFPAPRWCTQIHRPMVIPSSVKIHGAYHQVHIDYNTVPSYSECFHMLSHEYMSINQSVSSYSYTYSTFLSIIVIHSIHVPYYDIPVPSNQHNVCFCSQSSKTWEYLGYSR